MSTSFARPPSSSSSPAPASSSDRHALMSIGTECSHPSCHLHDFLPIPCPACHQPFCQPHFLPSTHSCTSPLPPSMIDRIAPQCPLCNTITPFPPGSTDPNDAVERHILQGTCTGLPGGEERKRAEMRARRERGEVCWRKGCGKGLVVKMRCQGCGRDFCPSHRHATEHACAASGESSRSSTPGPQAQGSRPTAKAALARLMPNNNAKPTPSSSTPATVPPAASKAALQPSAPRPVAATAPSASSTLDARGAAAAAALRRAGQDLKADLKAPITKHKTDKRAAAEQASALQALQARHAKGLLSKQEEVKLAEMLGQGESSRRRGEGKTGSGGKGKGDCRIA